MKYLLSSIGLAALIAISGPAPVQADTDAKTVIETYVKIAQAGYADSLTTARNLQSAVEQMLAQPTVDTMSAARKAWIEARRPYQQTEVYRFGNAIVDEWEGRVNAWPLDEGLIDYVDASHEDATGENAFYNINIIANRTLTAGGKTIDATEITPALLESLHEVGGIEANVATGYHAIEFLLWGQDLNGTRPGAGNRPHSDFDTANCTNDNCGRRADYLRAAVALLITDLQEMARNWAPEGRAVKALLDGAPSVGLKAILTGMGSLSYGELAGERMKLGLMLHDPEEEHDCFSDNTHESHFYDALGIKNVYNGRYRRIDGSMVEGPSVSDLVKAKDVGVDRAVMMGLDNTIIKMSVLKNRAETVERYDQMIGEENDKGNAVVHAAIDALVSQTRSLEKAVAILGLRIDLEGSDSLDNPGTVK